MYKVEVIYLFDEKDVERKLNGVSFTKAEEFEWPQAVIAVFENDNKAVLHKLELRKHSENWPKYLRKRRFAVRRREKANKNK